MTIRKGLMSNKKNYRKAEQINAIIVQLTLTCPMDSLSRSLKDPLLVSLVCFSVLSVAATGKRTGSSTIPDKTNMPKTETNRKNIKN